MIPKEVLITSQDLVDWIDRPPSNDDLDLCNYLENAVKNQYKYKNVIDKIKELIERKLSTETYQHLKKLYDDIDSTEEIWEDYEFEDLLDILELLEEVE